MAIRVVVAGYGNVGRGVIAAVKNNPDMVLAGVVSRSPERVKKELSALGFSFPDSKTNFLFATHERVPAAELFAMLREKHIFVRYFKTPRIDNYLRITIGTDAQMDRLLEVLKEYLQTA